MQRSHCPSHTSPTGQWDFPQAMLRELFQQTKCRGMHGDGTVQLFLHFSELFMYVNNGALLIILKTHFSLKYVNL